MPFVVVLFFSFLLYSFPLTAMQDMPEGVVGVVENAEQFKEVPLTRESLSDSFDKKDYECFKYLLERGAPFDWRYDLSLRGGEVIGVEDLGLLACMVAHTKSIPLKVYEYALSSYHAGDKSYFDILWNKRDKVYTGDLMLPFGECLLCQASQSIRNIDIFRFLLSQKDARPKTEKGWADLFHSAARGGVIEALTLLLKEKDVSIDLKYFGETALMRAISSGSSTVVNFLLSNGASVAEKDSCGRLALHYCAKCEDQATSVDLAKLLLFIDTKEPFNEKDENGYTPLSLAVINKNVPLFHFLIDQGADVDVRSAENESLLWIASNNCREMLSGVPEVIKDLINYGVDIDAQDSEGCAPLHRAVYNSSVATVEYFLDHDANVNITDCEGMTPLMMAVYLVDADRKDSARECRKNIIKKLLEHDASINAKDEKGLTALHHAIEFHSEFVQLLLDNHADAHYRDEGDNTLIHYKLRLELEKLTDIWYSVKKSHRDDIPRIIELLVKAGVDSNARNNDGIFPIHLAVQYYILSEVIYANKQQNKVLVRMSGGCVEDNLPDNKPVIDCLLEHGADINVKNKDGKTVLDFAVAAKNDALKKFLRERGACPSK